MTRLVMGIDPGSRKTGYGLIAVEGSVLRRVASGVIDVSGHDFFDRLKIIHETLSELLRVHQPTEAAIEDVFVSKNASSALKLGHARGAAIIALMQQVPGVATYTARHVKKAIVGYGAAEKHQMQHMVRLILSLTDPLKEDEADALGVAITHIHQASILPVSGGSDGRASTRSW